MSVYRVVVFLHVFSALVFMMAHGVSAMMMFKVWRERKMENLCNYLEISRWALNPAMRALEGVLLTGIILTVWAKWWMFGWIWASLALFVVISFVMAKFAAGYMKRVRKAIGMVTPRELKKGIRPQPVSYEELVQVLESGRPIQVTAAGLTGIAMLVFLMTVKPF